MAKKITLKSIYNLFFRSQVILIVALALFLGVTGALVNLHFETENRDQNLQNIAEAVAQSPIVTEYDYQTNKNSDVLFEYLDSLQKSLKDIDVISVVTKDNLRIYHTNHSLIGTEYDGTVPKFNNDSSDFYAVDETGPSGNQRRAYSAIYNKNGEYQGFVISVILMKNIYAETLQLLLIIALITIIAIVIEIIISSRLSSKVKKSLMGYEPDVFTTMYKMRNSILDALKEGIIAVDNNSVIQYANESAIRMLCDDENCKITGESIDILGDKKLSKLIKKDDKQFNLTIDTADIIADRVPIIENSEIVGKIAIFHNRAEYRKLMEDLSGTRYLVDSMRANNHDFTNKLHVILGLIQMEMYDQATSYIENITMVQRSTISKVMNAVNDPAVAALLIGKIARASELNVKFILREGCKYNAEDMNLPSEMLVTVIGNLLDNAYDAMNTNGSYNSDKELLFGIFSRPDAVLITVDDTGVGIEQENIERIFENGFSTKGEGRGTGLYQIKATVENFGGTITVESQKDIGTSFSVSFKKD